MLISPAFAADVATAATTTPEGPSFLVSMLPLVIIFALFYVLVLRPQSKRLREHAELLKGLTVGDKVITGGGLFGTITAVADDSFTIEIAPGVNVRAQKHTLTAVQETPVAK